MVLFIWNVALFKLPSTPDNTQHLIHNKSNSTYPLTKRKSSDLWKSLQYLSGIVNSVFKGCTGGRGGQSPPSGGTGARGGLTSSHQHHSLHL